MPAGKKSPAPVVTEPRKTYNVFVSSTYRDNEERRKIVADAITMAGMVWHGMELFTASTHPTVEECLRHAREADLLVGIIARRYGWIPEGEDISITEMEYDAARDRLMFVLDSTLPFAEEDFDPLPDRWKKQDKLDTFKKKFSADQMPAYFKPTTLQAKILKALNDWREEREGPRAEASPASQSPILVSEAAGVDEEIRNYGRKAETLHARLPVAGFATRLKVPIDIEEIYVPLRAMLDLRGVDAECFADSAHAEKVLCGRNAGVEVSLPEAFEQAHKRGFRNILILGDPGSGKTTHLKRVMLYCLRKGPAGIGLPEDMLPVFLPLRNLKDLKKGLDAFIEEELDSPHLKTPPGFGDRMLRRGKLLYLLDGLDEVADLAQREEAARWIVAAQQADPTCCRFVVTCRFAGYSPTVRLSADFLEMHLRPLTEEQVAAFVHNWYRVVEKGLALDPDQAESIARERAENLINRLKEPDFRTRRVFELTRNPLLLANICLVHRHRGELPQKRARLYEECIDVLLEHWRKAKGLRIGVTAQDGRRVLQPAALWLHGEENRIRASAAELSLHIDPALKAVDWSGGGGADFLRTIRDDSGLLTGWDQENYGFMHLGFQEYMAAREICRRGFEEPQVLQELAAHFGESWWQEVTLLLLALEDPSLFVPFMRALVKIAAFADHPGLVDLCLDDAAEKPAQPFVELLVTSPGTQQSLWRRQAAALRVLERLAPEQVDALRDRLARHPYEAIRRRMADRAAAAEQDVLFNELGEYEMVRIPAGSFKMGSPASEKGRWDNEGPQREVRVPAFFLGRYPVTNAQYARYLKAKPDVPEPAYWAERQFNQPLQPVVGVSWNDANEYARWTGLRLPSESEWEYACRAGTSTRFYSGSKDGDLKRSGWYGGNSENKLHPVGEKEPNAFGLYDIHGNVWEWMEDDYHKDYKKGPVDGRAWIDDPRGASRVVRGGGWFNVARYCRSATRNGDHTAAAVLGPTQQLIY